MKKNVNTVDALIRITLGLTGVAWGTAQLVRNPNRATPLMVTMASAMKVAEGITRYCPMLHMLGSSSEEILEDSKDMMKNMTQESSGESGRDRYKVTSKRINRNARSTKEKAREAALNEPLKEILEEYE